MIHVHRALLAAAVLAACATGTAAVAVPVPCCAKFYGIPGTCAASACPNKNATRADCIAACKGDEDCERANCDWLCRASVGADGTVQAGKIDCITWGGVSDGAGIMCQASEGYTAIKMSDNNGVGCPGYTGAITGKVACERSITTDFGPPEVTE